MEVKSMFIIIVGCGRLGSNLAKELADDGNDICIIDRDGNKLNSLGSGFNGKRIKGIEFDSDKLTEAGIKQADALLAVSSDDNINITVSLIAEKIFHISKIVARVNNPEKKTIYKLLGIETINPIKYEIEIIKSKLAIESMDIISTLDNNYQIIEMLVSKEKSSSVSEIEEKYNCIISCLIKKGTVILPEKSEQLKRGDRFICTVSRKDKGRLINSFSKEILL